MCTFLHVFPGFLLVLEYAWFLSQQPKNAGNYHPIEAATKVYQTSGTQTVVLNALQLTIGEHDDDDDDDECECEDEDDSMKKLGDVIIGIIHEHRMCKSISIKAKHLGSV